MDYNIIVSLSQVVLSGFKIKVFVNIFYKHIHPTDENKGKG